MTLKAMKTVIALDAEDVVRLQELMMDEDPEAAMSFVDEVIVAKLTCAQAESHRPEFEGGTGDAGAHYTQKGDGHTLPGTPE
jgi:hypothetical protein